MLSQQGFDLWADGYGKRVDPVEEVNEYPFAGYRDLPDARWGHAA